MTNEELLRERVEVQRDHLDAAPSARSRRALDECVTAHSDEGAAGPS
jgi:hypothetical protein